MFNTRDLKSGDTVTVTGRVNRSSGDIFILESEDGIDTAGFYHGANWQARKIASPVAYYRVVYTDKRGSLDVSDRVYKSEADFNERKRSQYSVFVQLLEATKELKYEH